MMLGMFGILLIFRPPFMLELLGLPSLERIQEDSMLHLLGLGLSLLTAVVVTFIQILIANLAKEVNLFFSIT
jgi:hypothetical protein